jgi:hypothetical protein
MPKIEGHSEPTHLEQRSASLRHTAASTSLATASPLTTPSRRLLLLFTPYTPIQILSLIPRRPSQQVNLCLCASSGCVIWWVWCAAAAAVLLLFGFGCLPGFQGCLLDHCAVGGEHYGEGTERLCTHRLLLQL